MQIVIYVCVALYLLTVASVIFNVILENRNPVRTLAWIIVLVTIPLLGFLFYLYFGVNYRKIKMFSRKGLGDMKWLQYMSEDQKQLIKKSEYLQRRASAEVRKLMTLLLNNSKALLTRYNTVEVLNNGQETFPALFDALRQARKFIHLEYYILGEGRLLSELESILLAKAAEGVEVRIIYDDVGSWSLSKNFIRTLRQAGIQIYPFLPVRYHKFLRKANYRNHRKIAVVDGCVGFVGGLNIADRYMDGVPGIGVWRDTHLKVQGEAVTSLQVIFLTDWYFVRQEVLLNKNEYMPYVQADGNAVVIEDMKMLSDLIADGTICLHNPVEIFSQTTKSPAEYARICSRLEELMAGAMELSVERFKGTHLLTVHNTICAQVASRHARLSKFALDHDIVIFVAGKASSNGKVLCSLCKSVNIRTYYIGGPNDVRKEWFRDDDKVGVCGATSTPKWLLEEVADYIKSL